MRFSKSRLISFACLAFHSFLILAQTATPTTNIFTRMTMVESSYGRGSTFSIDVDQREYWITAKHILTGAEHPPYGAVNGKSVRLRFLNPAAQGEQWISVDFSVLDPGKDIDIVVLAAHDPLLKNPLPSEPADSAGVFYGGDCEFLGFPYGGGWRANMGQGQSFWMPFVKHCNVSALSTAETKMWVLDGINNPGFSGGPVVNRTGADQRIFAVISGYHLEPAEVTSSAAEKVEPPKQGARLRVNVNSGFITAYDISYALSAIHDNPIGPLRQAK